MIKDYPRIATLKTADDFVAEVKKQGLDIPFDPEVTPAPEGALAQPFFLPNGRKIGNRFCVHPMEGWDCTHDGKPSDYTVRRWRNFGLSGAKLIWGGEAAAVRPDGRANPNQLMILDETMSSVEALRKGLIAEHLAHFGTIADLLVGLQLTHSGRFSRPNEKTKLEPKILYHHPLLEKIYNVSPDTPVMTDGEIDDLIGYYVRAAKRAQVIGFDFVDVKHCHGYLGHEFLSSYTRPGKYGGSFENRTRFLREIVKGIQSECPGLLIGVRVSIFDFPPFRPDKDNVGYMMEYRDENGRYPFAFGGDPDHPGQVKLDEPIAFLELLEEIGVQLVNFSAASPYYNHHVTRPAYFPPSDGYEPPEDPLVGVARHIRVDAELKKHVKNLACVGSGYSYLQDWIPNVAQAVVRQGMIDFVGLGRSTLSYPELPADVLNGCTLKRTHICRTFSDCTTAPRKGLISGCYPLDAFYKGLPECQQLKKMKKGLL
ncbi:MAG TPA: NADH:flavin oxidoreductase [Longilinea sp.]|nr:NADH:flavin oxidoreductase [Longilinea sp.]